MSDREIQKVDVFYLLSYILGPVALTIVATGITALLPFKNVWPVVLAVFLIASFVWWVVGSEKIFAACREKLERRLDFRGFHRSQTFLSDGCEVILDAHTGSMALLFCWNPFHPYVFPASRVDKIWVEDGKRGWGPLTGSKRVSFLFTVGQTTVRVNTFSSNQKWKMDSDYILTGISKADMMAQLLERAGKRSG